MFLIRLADLVIQINNRFDLIERDCASYFVKEKRTPDLVITTTDEDMKLGRRVRLQDGFTDSFPANEESIGLYNRIYRTLLMYDVIWIHSSAVAMDGEGYIFTAPSGYGKTTHARMWIECFPSRAQIINGDCPLIRRKNGVYHVYGTPFCGKEGYNVNTDVQLKGICYLTRARENSIRKMDPSVAFGQLVRQQQHFIDDQNRGRYLELFGELVENVSVYQLFFNPTKEAALTAYEGMKNGRTD